MIEYALEMIGVSKEFPGVKALDDVTLRVKAGEVHAIIGENGAGKSTLMKILNGAYHADKGEVRLFGKNVTIQNVNEARQNGISLIFQEINLIPTLSVTENFFLGELPTGRFGRVDWKGMERQVRKVFDEIGFSLDPASIVSEISVAEKQMVEIARAISKNAKIIVMDEPTSSLTEVEVEKLFRIIAQLKAQQVTILYISHKLEEIFAICDSATVLRDGHVIETKPVAEYTRDQLIEKMVGRSVTTEYPKRNHQVGEVIFSARNIRRKNLLYGIDFELRRGEVLGLAGLVGAGRTELCEAIFGAEKMQAGEITINGKVVRIRNTQQAKRHSIGMVTEERKETGLALGFSVKRNISITNLPRIAAGGIWLTNSRENKAAEEYVEELRIKTPGIRQTVENLSGGNQQKVVIAKWLFSNVDILILDEPTRGIDVGAKFEIYQLINRLAEQGKAIIMISSEMPELLGMSDRVIVMHDGKKKGELSGEQLCPEAVMKLAVEEGTV